MKPYIICETAYNHQGDFDYLLEMIREIGSIGVQAIKFHLLLNCNSYLQKNHPLMTKIKQYMFSKEVWSYFIKTSYERGLDIIALCDDIESIMYINKMHKDIKAIEIHSSSLNDYYMLKEASKFKNQVILGIGGTSIDEITYAVNFLKENGKKEILLMYGFQSYPTSYSNINISKILKLKELFDLEIGYADHTAYDDVNNAEVSAIASAIGINVLEKHYTLNKGEKRLDYQSAVGKEEILEVYKKMEMNLKIYGDNSLIMSEDELIYGNVGPMKKAIVARKNILKGELLTFDNLWFKRTGEESPLKQSDFLNLIGLEASKDIKEDEIIDYSKVNFKYNKSLYLELTGGVE